MTPTPTPAEYAQAEAIFNCYVGRGVRGQDRPQLYAPAEANLAAALAARPDLAPALAAHAAARSGEYHGYAADWQALAIGAERIAQIARAVEPLPTVAVETLDASIEAGFADLDRLAAGDADGLDF
jgi:hypothetical protein